MNILVTGANGFIGRHLVSRLKQDNFTVIELSNSDKFIHHNLKYSFNLLNKEHIEEFLLQKLDIDIIIHTASKLGMSKEHNKLSIFYDNITMYEHLSSIIEHFKPKRVINFSSIAVYPNKDGDYDEHSEVRPSINTEGMYGLSKFCGENILDFINKTSNITHLRIAQVYGDGVREGSIFKVMQKELEETNNITVFGNGRRVSNFIELSMLIEKIILFVENDMSGIFNIGKTNLSYKELALQTIKQYGNKDSKITLVSNGVNTKCFINTDKLENIELELTTSGEKNV